MKIFSRAFQEIKNALYKLRARFSHISGSVQYDVPYVCQFATPASAELSLTKKLAPVDDPHWEKTGAKSPERYAQWAFTMCGMASAAMALGHFKNLQVKPAELAEDALRHGVYIETPDDISSMRYVEFAEWIRGYGLQAEVYSRLSVMGIRYALSRRKLVIVSVNPNIRGYDTAPKSQKGGHLVLVTGYNIDKNTIAINNPSGFVNSNTQIHHTLPMKEFAKYYAGRGIVISNLL